MTTTTKKPRYNGWPNRAAWNVALWVGNDEPRYRWMLDARKGLPRQRFSAENARLHAAEQFPTGVTPDGDKLADVTREGWRDIAAGWNDD